MQNLDRKSSSSLAEPPRRFRIDQGPLKRSLLDFTNLSISDDSGLSGNVGLEINERPLKRSLLDFGNLSISDSSQNVGADSEANMTESSLTAPPLKHVFVRVKRKPFQSPLDAFRLEIMERPLKHPLSDFGNLSIANSSQNMEFHDKKVLVQHVKTISDSEDTLDIVRSFLELRSRSASKSKSKVDERKNFFKEVNRQDQLVFKAKQEKESSAIDARFKQIWKTSDENALQKICQFYDIVRVDYEEKIKEEQQEDISLEDQRRLANFIPLLIDVIPKAAAEIEADTSVHSKQEDYVYDLYTVMDELIVEEESPYCYPLVQVDDEHFYDGPDNSDYETDDSNVVDTSVTDYLAMFSEEEDSECKLEESMAKVSEEEVSECESEESMHGSYCDESEGSTPKFSEEEGSESESEEINNDGTCNELSSENTLEEGSESK
ncbi:RNA-directed DNA methylation 4-like isoform X2 [Trifolium pratense]|uniref:RNA-directed DNA methylation 4-like isoform X2 n=1 Tax=Trifolium pratense TaxID=57577 RepID=UPI001E693ED7|nr:RNA-directed DNA methylation 4-like isoform X2 [Trifolium pratense]